MHILLTDRLVCPVCGPEYGLILLAHEVRERRVLEGDLGCSKCRETYPVRAGFGDLRPSPRSPLPSPGDRDPVVPEPGEVVRLGAFLGVTEGPATLLLLGPLVRFAGPLAALIGQVEVVGIDASLADEVEESGVSRLMAGSEVPFLSGSFRGVAVGGPAEEEKLKEAARLVAPNGRVVVFDGLPGVKETLKGLGLTVLLDEDRVLVTRREPAQTLPLVTLRGP